MKSSALRALIISAVFTFIGLIPSVRAENDQAVIVNGFSTNMSGIYQVGVTGTNNSLQIINGGSVTNGETYIGNSATADKNFVLVDGLNSLLYNTVQTATGTVNGVWVSAASGSDSNRMIVSNGGQVDTLHTFVDRFTANNNLLLVTDTGTVYRSRYSLDVGNGGDNNQLIVSNGATMRMDGGFDQQLRIGLTGNNNLITVTGAGTIMTNNVRLYVGSGSGSGNAVRFTGGATVYTGQGAIGIGTGSNSSVTVTGPNTRWVVSTLTESLTLGAGGPFSQLVISNGAFVSAGDIYVGRNTIGTNSLLVVTGQNSVLTNSSFLDIGTFSPSNRMVVADGGKVATTLETRMGAISSSVGNSATITGPGSVWSDLGNIVVGDAGDGTTLVVSNAGSVVLHGSGAPTLIVGRQATSPNNLVRVDGGSIIATNSVGTVPGINVQRGLLQVNSGTIDTESLLVNSGASGTIQFNGGTIVSRATTINTGSAFIIGNGSGTAANYQMNGGTHTMTDGMTISSDGRLSGNGTVVGVVNQSGTIAPGFSPGQINISGNLTQALSATLEIEIAGTGQGTTYDFVSVSGNAILDGLLDVDLLNAFLPTSANTFTVLTANAISGFFTNAPTSGGSYRFDSGFWEVNYTAQSVILSDYVVPEPSTLLLFASGAVVLWRARRSRQGE